MDNPWLDIRNSSGHLLFRYNPYTNEVEFKKNGHVYDLVRLDEIRVHYKVIEFAGQGSKMDIWVVPEKKENGK